MQPTHTDDYEAMLKMLCKFHVPTVTVHKGDVKHIISFGAQCTMEYVFEGNELFDVKVKNLSFLDWFSHTFLFHKGDGSIITIYNN